MKTHFQFILLALAILMAPELGRAQGCAPAKSEDGVNLFGFLQPQFEVKFDKDGPKQSFTFNRARIGVAGNIPYDISYYAVIETSPFKANGSAFLLDGFVAYNRWSFARIALGKFKSPFTLEMATPCHELNTIYRSGVVQNLVSPDRDFGIMVLGDLLDKKLSYSVALTNGNGLGAFDSNNGKTLHSRVVISPLSFVKVGGGVQYGTHKSIVPDASEEDTRFRWSADLQIKHQALDIIGEYIHGMDKGSYAVGGGCGGAPTIIQGDLKRRGYYVHAQYKTNFNLQPLVRYENWNTDLDTKNRNENTMVFGANYWLNDWTRIQANYLYKSEERLEVKNDEFLIQVQVFF